MSFERTPLESGSQLWPQGFCSISADLQTSRYQGLNHNLVHYWVAMQRESDERPDE